jgi:hypothetical protein
MVVLKKYIKFLYAWITLYSYWLINLFVTSYFSYVKGKNNDFLFYFSCFMSAIIGGLITCVIMDWFDLFPNFVSLDCAINIPPNLSTTDFILDELVEQKELETQKELEQIREHTKLWLITTLIVYSIVFYYTT